MTEKQALRAVCRACLAKETPAQRAALSAAITQKLLSLPQYAAAKTVFCFAGRADEIDTAAFLRRALADGKTVCVPFCESKGVMTARRIVAPEDLQLGAYGIAEPPKTVPVIAPQSLDFCVLPCLCADAAGNRLGYGAGFYDRFLALCRTDVFSAAVCRAALLQTALPTEPHDVPAACVVTERDVAFTKQSQTRRKARESD